MRIKAGELVVENPSCRGCMCHEMAMTFGSNPNRCAQCGCPLSEAGVREYAAQHPDRVLS